MDSNTKAQTFADQAKAAATTAMNVRVDGVEASVNDRFMSVAENVSSIEDTLSTIQPIVSATEASLRSAMEQVTWLSLVDPWLAYLPLSSFLCLPESLPPCLLLIRYCSWLS